MTVAAVQWWFFNVLVDHELGWPYTQLSMMERKTPVIVSGIWQIIRFIILVLGSILFLNPMAYVGTSLLVVLLSAPSLAFAVICFFAGLHPPRFASLRGFLFFGKAFEVIPGLLLLILQGGALYFGIARPVFDEVLFLNTISGYSIETALLFLYILAGVVLLDLIFLFVLLSYRAEPDSPVPHRESIPGENLPVYTITEIEEE